MINKIKQIILMITGTFLTAAAASVFLNPNKIVCGGVSGISTILYYFSDIPMSVSYAVINAVLLLIGFKILGKVFTVKTIIGAALVSVFIEILSYVPTVTEDAFLAAVFGGILYGTGLGITFISGASTGGTDIVGRLIQYKFPQLPIGKLLMVIDGVVIAISFMVFRNTNLILMGIIGVCVQSVTIDFMIGKMNISTMAFIITEKGEEISKKLLTEAQRGVTIVDARGAWTMQEKQLLICVVKPQETANLRDRIENIDSEAFVIFSPVKYVVGNGFKIYR